MGLRRPAFLRVAHPVLDLGEGLFDRIDVERAGRQKPEPGAEPAVEPAWAEAELAGRGVTVPHNAA